MPAPTRYIRYQSTMVHAKRDAVSLGIFAAVNTLAKRGFLSAEQERFRVDTNQWFNENLPLPTDADPTLYAEPHWTAVAWFKQTAALHLAQIPGYLAILDAHGIGWHELKTSEPGPILYEDAFQVVVATPPDLATCLNLP